MKRIVTIMMLTVVMTLGMWAHPEQKFDPKRFDAELQKHITTEAKLTAQEAAKFFPVYKEMLAKQRAIFNQINTYKRAKPKDEKSCKENIKKCDELDLQLKQLQQTYHNKFLKMFSASKVYDILQAEDSFHRQMFRQSSHQGPKSAPQHRGGNR